MTIYIIKSSTSLLLLFGLYWFLLRKEKLFVFNRVFLVGSVVFSLIVPFISIPVNFQVTTQLNEIIPTYNDIMTEISIADKIVPNEANNSQSYAEKQPSVFNIPAFLFAFYISGVILLLIRFLRNIYLITRRSKLSEKINSKGYRILLTDDKTGPCCFFKNIFLNKDDYLNGKIYQELLNHELEHVRQFHTFDIILIELVKIFYWFNPIHILYDRAIRINHEYLADNGVINDNSDIKSYADKLLGFITGRSNMSLTSGSNNSFTKMRLLMMMKSTSGSFIYSARIVITLCMVTVFFLLLSFKESGQQPSVPNLSQTGTQELKKDNLREKDVIYEKAEKMPQYPGGETELRKFIATNLKYPEAAKTQKAEGIVIARFVVNTKGDIEDVEIMQGVHPAIDAEVLRIVGKLERFVPGFQGGKPVNVYYMLPVTFRLPAQEPLFTNTSESAILKFLGMNIKYPKEAKAASDTGTIYVVVKLEKGGSIKECKPFTDKTGIKVPFLPEVIIVGYKSSIEPGDLRPGKTTGNTPGNGMIALQTECVRVANMLSLNEIPDWKDKNIEFAITFKFVLK
jgi:TonB family protein